MRKKVKQGNRDRVQWKEERLFESEWYHYVGGEDKQLNESHVELIQNNPDFFVDRNKSHLLTVRLQAITTKYKFFFCTRKYVGHKMQSGKYSISLYPLPLWYVLLNIELKSGGDST